MGLITQACMHAAWLDDAVLFVQTHAIV